jgi:hypothetical protein
MEKRVAKKVEQYQITFKKNIKDWIDQNECVVMNPNNDDITSEFLKFVFDFDSISLTKEDFQKRKRVKNIVPQFERCTAKRATGEQCTRRKKDDSCFCGTHVKGTPHGIVEENVNDETLNAKKVEVWVQEIKGINYYIDNENNVYYPEDIISNKNFPRKIGKWIYDDDNGYSIPELNL